MEIIKLKGYDHLYAVDSFFSEYQALFGKSAAEHRKYLIKLRKNLGILDREMKSASTGYQQFEKLEGVELWSIRHVSKFNPRVIYAFFMDDEKIILISSFKEHNKSDYERGIQLAKARIKQLEVTL